MANKINFITGVIILIVSFGCADEDLFKTDISDFESLKLKRESFWNGSNGQGFFIDNNKIYNNTFYPDWNTWSGFVYSNVINNFYYNSKSIYSSYPSGGAKESDNYAIGHQFEKMIITFVDSTKGEEPRTVQLGNCTYTALAIQNGYGYAKKFGGRDGSDPDWFKVSITGIGMYENVIGTIDFFLADFRFDDPTKDYVVNKWEFVDLTSLGRVSRLEFQLSSSDPGTPLYFCLDNLKGRIPN